MKTLKESVKINMLISFSEYLMPITQRTVWNEVFKCW